MIADSLSSLLWAMVMLVIIMYATWLPTSMRGLTRSLRHMSLALVLGLCLCTFVCVSFSVWMPALRRNSAAWHKLDP